MIIKYPEFKNPPQSNLADVEENIKNWIERNQVEKIKTFLRPYAKSKYGYRFVTSDELEETIETTQKILGVEVNLIFTRRYHASNRSFCPLYYTEWNTSIFYYIDGKRTEGEEWVSDAQLKRFIKSYKQTIKDEKI